jgi:cathepsin H
VLLAVTTAIYSFESAPKTVESILDRFMDGSVKELFKVWHLVFKKTYTFDSNEAKERYANFKVKVAEIKSVNSQNLSYKLGLNEFSDMSYEEFSRIYLSKQVPLPPTTNFLEEEDDDLTKRNLEVGAAEINHTKYFGAVRHQGSCGSCWTYATTGVMEAAFSMKNGQVYPYFSTQQLVDCDRAYSFGCQGGWPDKALSYYTQQKGLMLDSVYPYLGYEGQCRYNTQAALYRNRGVRGCNAQSTTPCSINTLYSLLSTGPMAVLVDAGGDFGSYRSGVWMGDCRSSQYPNHAVILVGYGVDSTTGYQYWLIRNSWGATWGLQGYIKVAVNENNKGSCFIQSQAYAPTL